MKDVDINKGIEQMLTREKEEHYHHFSVDEAVKMRLDNAFDARFGSKKTIKKGSVLTFDTLQHWAIQHLGIRWGLSALTLFVVIASLFFQINKGFNVQGGPAVFSADTAQALDTSGMRLDSMATF